MHDFCKAIILVALFTLHVNWSIAAPPISIQLGPRPMYLVDAMDDSLLKKTLQKCESGPFKKSDFSADKVRTDEKFKICHNFE
jgi:glycerophosphoryl diester phosphodiesterase